MNKYQLSDLSPFLTCATPNEYISHQEIFCMNNYQVAKYMFSLKTIKN